MMTVAAAALAAFVFAAGSSQTVWARTPHVKCVRTPGGERICRLHATGAEQRG
jgi:hypothetical protein